MRSTTRAVAWNGFSPSSATLTLGKLLNCSEPLHANKSNSSPFQCGETAVRMQMTVPHPSVMLAANVTHCFVLAHVQVKFSFTGIP